MRHGSFIVLLAVVTLIGCAQPIRTGTLIDQYVRAACVPVTLSASYPSRTWNSGLETREGAIQVHGMAIPGGGIVVRYASVVVRYASDGKEETAASAGDYIYPADVRFDRTSEHLYIKASGVRAFFGSPETWLFEYDLRARHQTQRAQVDPSALPNECSVNNSN